MCSAPNGPNPSTERLGFSSQETLNLPIDFVEPEGEGGEERCGKQEYRHGVANFAWSSGRMLARWFISFAQWRSKFRPV